MSFQHPVRLLPARRPHRNPGIGPRGHHAAVLQKDDRIDGIGVIPQHLLGRVRLQRPANGCRVEASRQEAVPIGRNGKRPYRTTVTGHVGARG
jgi:hypothetical protein